MDVDELVARERIRETVATYAHLVDGGRFEELCDLFDPDGVLEVAGAGEHRGRDELRAFFGGVGADLAAGTTVPHIRHHTSNLTIEVTGPTTARARCYFLALTEHGADHWGRYRDDLVAGDDGRWRFARRRVRTDGTAPGSWAARRT